VPSGTEEYHHALQEGRVGTFEEFLVLSEPQEEPTEEDEAEQDSDQGACLTPTVYDCIDLDKDDMLPPTQL
jgi:hypothetical protein